MTDEWLSRAACRGRHRIMLNPDHVGAAKAICRMCPVITECADDAATTEDSLDPRCIAGVRAGMTPAEFAARTRRRSA